MPAPSKTPFNVELDQADRDRLSALAARAGLPRSQVIRNALRALHAMEIANRPTCANGHPCFVPHMHAQHAAAAAPPSSRNPEHPAAPPSAGSVPS